MIISEYLQLIRVHYFLAGYMGIANGSIHAAIVTVVMVHVIIGFYIRSAWNEEVAADKPKDD